MVCIGKILKSQGIKGEVKASLFIDHLKDAQRISVFFIDEKPYHVASVRLRDGFYYLQFDEVLSRNDSDLLRGKELFIDQRLLPKLPKNRFYISDLIGCKIVHEGGEIGVITDINNYGSADVVSFAGERSGMFPYLNVVVSAVDLANKTMQVVLSEFEKVCVYED